MTVLQIKAFIYRLSDAFGHSIYLAQKEEDLHIASFNPTKPSEFYQSLERGSWQCKHGFTRVFTWGEPWYVAFWAKLKHAVGK